MPFNVSLPLRRQLTFRSFFADFGTDDTHPSPPLFRPDDLQRHGLFGVGGSRYRLGVPVGICSRVVPPVGKQSCASDDFERADQGKRSVFPLRELI